MEDRRRDKEIDAAQKKFEHKEDWDHPQAGPRGEKLLDKRFKDIFADKGR